MEKENKKKDRSFLRKHWYKIILLLIIILFSLRFIISLGTRVSNYFFGGSSDQIVDFGETLEVGHVTYVIDGIEIAETINVLGSQSGVNEGVFLIADVTVTNNSRRNVWVGSGNFMILYDGEYYPADSSLVLYAAVEREEEPLWHENMDSGETFSGIILFVTSDEIANSEETSIVVFSETWGEQEGTIRLER